MTDNLTHLTGPDTTPYPAPKPPRKRPASATAC